MTTTGPTPGNSAQNPAARGFGKTLLAVLVIVLAATAAIFAVRSLSRPKAELMPGREGQPPQTAELRVGATLPDFELKPYKSSGTYAVSSLRSKVYLINFWATWCEACMVEMPSIVKLYEAYKARGFDVLAVNLDQNPETVLPRTLQKYSMTFTVFTDQDSKLADLFQIQAIPLSVVMDANRKILLIENEGLDWNGSAFRNQLEKWL